MQTCTLEVETPQKAGAGAPSITHMTTIHQLSRVETYECDCTRRTGSVPIRYPTEPTYGGLVGI